MRQRSRALGVMGLLALSIATASACGGEDDTVADNFAGNPASGKGNGGGSSTAGGTPNGGASYAGRGGMAPSASGAAGAAPVVGGAGGELVDLGGAGGAIVGAGGVVSDGGVAAGQAGAAGDAGTGFVAGECDAGDVDALSTVLPTCAGAKGDSVCITCAKKMYCSEYQNCYGTEPTTACGTGQSQGQPGQFDCIVQCFADGASQAGDPDALLASCADQCDDGCPLGINNSTNELVAASHDKCLNECFPFN